MVDKNSQFGSKRLLGEIARYSKILSGLIAILLLAAPFLIGRNIESFRELGYLGFFLANYFGVGIVLIPFLVQTLDPVLLILVGSFGVTIDEFFAWYAGSISKELNRKRKFDQRVQGFIEKYGVKAVFVLGLIPLPDGVVYSIAGFAAGFYQMPFINFFLANFLGKLIRTTVIVLIFYFALVK